MQGESAADGQKAEPVLFLEDDADLRVRGCVDDTRTCACVCQQTYICVIRLHKHTHSHCLAVMFSLFFFFGCIVACGILVPNWGLNLYSLQPEVQNLKCWASREFPNVQFSYVCIICKLPQIYSDK